MNTRDNGGVYMAFRPVPLQTHDANGTGTGASPPTAGDPIVLAAMPSTVRLLSSTYGPIAFGVICLLIIWWFVVQPEMALLRMVAEKVDGKDETIREVAATLERTALSIDRASTTMGETARTMEKNSERMERIIERVEGINP